MTDSHPPSEYNRHLAEGEAALMLVESLMLALVEHQVLSPDQISAAVETVIAVKRQASGVTEEPAVAAAAVGILTGIANSVLASRPGDGARRR